MKAHVMLFSSLLFSLSIVAFAVSSSRQLPILFPPVIDITGTALKLGEAYHVFTSAFLHPEDGLCLVDFFNKISHCPNDVVHCTLGSHKLLLAIPIIFRSAEAGIDVVVRENTSYNVQFNVDGNCHLDTFWSLAHDHNPFFKYVRTNPLAPPVRVQLHKTVFGYKIVCCEVIPIPFTPVCYPVGFVPDGGYSRLGIGFGVNGIQFLFKSNATVVDKLQATS